MTTFSRGLPMREDYGRKTRRHIFVSDNLDQRVRSFCNANGITLSGFYNRSAANQLEREQNFLVERKR